jgi:hypothetical protein
MRPRLTSTVVILVAASSGCFFGGRVMHVPSHEPSPELVAQFWRDPGVEPRDLFWGIGGRKYAPPADDGFIVKAKDESGFSVSYDVLSADGVEWSAKIGPEAQTEVVMSRVLWGLGYHQPPLYYLPFWNRADGGQEQVAKESEARFRPKLPQLTRGKIWEWQENPFIGTRPFNGLIVTLLMFNSTDLKNDNNTVYELKEPWDGATRWFVVRDLGASLGVTGKVFPRRNWIEGFEKKGFIIGVKNGQIQFDYDGRHRELIDAVTPADVHWAASQLQKLSDDQWHDAFRSANYADAIADRYIHKLKEKIAQGLAVREDTAH